jgi:hypothetical protein
MTTLSRRALVAGSAISAIPMPVLAAAAALAPDPIFAAIERHKAAWRNCEQCQTDEEIAQTCDAAGAEALALLEINPTTLTGVAALLRYSAEFDAKWESAWPERLYVDDKVTWPEENTPEWWRLEREGRWHVWLQHHAANAIERIVNS